MQDSKTHTSIDYSKLKIKSLKEIKELRDNIDKLSEPSGKWFKIDDFRLDKIPSMFSLCDFQRPQNRTHVSRILESIINNQFYDNMIRCIKVSPNTYKVIDGQHRLSALWLLHKNYNVQTYPLTIQIFSEDEAARVFRKINSGKTLSLNDHLKTYDNHTYPFFDELRSFCTHNNQKNKMTFTSAINSYYYCTKSSVRPVSIYDLEDTLLSISKEHIDYLYRLAKAASILYEKTLNPRLFNATIQRVCYRIGVSNNFTSIEFEKLLSKLVMNEEMIEMALQRFSTHEKEAYAVANKIFEDMRRSN